MKFENLRTVKQLAAESPFSEGTIRHWIFFSEINGLSKALVKIGGRIFIDLEQFSIWLEEHRLGEPCA